MLSNNTVMNWNNTIGKSWNIRIKVEKKIRLWKGPRSSDWSCAQLPYPINRIDIGVVFSYTPYTRDTNTLSLSPWFNKKVSFNTLCWKAITSACTAYDRFMMATVVFPDSRNTACVAVVMLGVIFIVAIVDTS